MCGNVCIVVCHMWHNSDNVFDNKNLQFMSHSMSIILDFVTDFFLESQGNSTGSHLLNVPLKIWCLMLCDPDKIAKAAYL